MRLTSSVVEASICSQSAVEIGTRPSEGAAAASAPAPATATHHTAHHICGNDVKLIQSNKCLESFWLKLFSSTKYKQNVLRPKNYVVNKYFFNFLIYECITSHSPVKSSIQRSIYVLCISYRISNPIAKSYLI